MQNKHEVIALNHSYSPASRRTDLHDLNDSMEIHHQQQQHAMSSHAGVQTSPELLDNYVVGLRKRNRSITSLRSLEEMRDARQSAAAARLQQDITAGQQDCLLRPNKLQYNDQSPLLASYEQSPLLSRDESFPAPGSTTSEETLSDPEDTLNDIEELLSGACPHEGSFASLCTDSPVAHNYQRPQSLSHGLGTKPTSKITSPCSPPALALPSSAIPRIDIELASPCPSEGQGNTSPPNAPSNAPPHASSNAPPQKAPASSQASCPTQASSQASSPPPNEPELCFNGQGDEEEEEAQDEDNNRDSNSVSKFQAYLRSKGIELDITSVQSSDV